MAGGRPTKYSEDMLKQTIDYINGGYESLGHVIPSVAGLSIVLGVVKSTVWEWSKDNQEFSSALGQLAQKQEMVLTGGGLAGQYNPAITKLILATNHGYSEKQQIEHQGSIQHTQSDTETARRIAYAMSLAQDSDDTDSATTH
jgi:DNA-packaging protein gp3